MIDYQMETVRATARQAQAERPITTPHTHMPNPNLILYPAPPAGAHEPAAVQGLSQPTQSSR